MGGFFYCFSNKFHMVSLSIANHKTLYLMNKTIFLGLAALALFSCSNDDSNETVQAAGIELDTVTFIDGGNEGVMIFEDNKVREYHIGPNDDDTYDSNYTYTYGADGQLTGMVSTDAQGQMTFSRVVAYDAQGRIIAKDDTYYVATAPYSSENVVYTYNEDNTVTADFTSYDDTVQDRTYHFNSAGLVYKVTNGNEIAQELSYNGNNVSAIGTTSYLYDESTPVKGEYLNIYRNMFNSYSNFVVYNGYIVPFTVSDKYMISTVNSYETINSVYEFNEDGYPVKVQGQRPQRPQESVQTTVITYK